MMIDNNTSFNYEKHIPEIQVIFYQILAQAILLIRVRCEIPRLCFLIADHVHNIPSFMRKPYLEFIERYLEQKEWFEEKLIELGHKSDVRFFDQSWTELEQLVQQNSANILHKKEPTRQLK